MVAASSTVSTLANESPPSVEWNRPPAPPASHTSPLTPGTALILPPAGRPAAAVRAEGRPPSGGTGPPPPPASHTSPLTPGTALILPPAGRPAAAVRAKVRPPSVLR